MYVIIPTSLLKTCSGVFSEIIANLANFSFIEGSFPSYLKTVQISLRLKSQDQIHTSHQTIVLSQIRTIFQSSPSVSSFSNSTSRLDLFSFQSTSIRYHSTEISLLLTTDQIFNSIDHEYSILLVSIDSSTAFDTIDNHILLDRLHTSFGICNTVLDWLSSYLIIGSSSYFLGHSRSTTTTCTTGVSQGSVLGPILLSCSLLYGLNSHKLWRPSKTLYADDIQLYISISHSNTSQLHDIEDCLLSLFSWFSHNGLSLTDAVPFGTDQSVKSISNISNINVACTSVVLSGKVKLLGVTLDRHLTLNSHIVQVCRSHQSTPATSGTLFPMIQRSRWHERQ